MFKHFPKERITLIKQDGQRIETEAIVSQENMTVTDVNLLVDAGDTIERKIPNGKVEAYEVLDPGYTGEFPGIPAHFDIKVRNRNRASSHGAPSSIVNNTTYYNSGQVAAMGPNATASGNVMLQQVQQPWSAAELAQVAAELSQLKKELAKQLAAGHDSDADDAIEIGHVGAAQKAANKGDQAGVVAALKSFGRKSWGLVEQLGLAFLKMRAGEYLGLPPGDNKQ
jgi:hypothetical protein